MEADLRRTLRGFIAHTPFARSRRAVCLSKVASYVCIALASAGGGPALAQSDPVADTALSPPVESAPLAGNNIGGAGLLPPKLTGLPASLWRASDGDTIASLFAAIDPPLPALTSLMRTLALAEAAPPAGNGTMHLVNRIDWLIADGAVEEALALLELAGTDSPDLFSRWADLTLLLGRTDLPCRKAETHPSLLNDPSLAVFCAARGGDWGRAVLLLTTYRTLGDIPQRRIDLLERFLDPDVNDERGPLAPPLRPTPLEFRLFEALGEPLPTAPLPLAFAVLDLGGENGWRAQIEAAERLARAGALPPNRLLGLYTQRQPAASGGVWDRVSALQVFERALDGDNPSFIAQSLVTAWPQMVSAGLLVPFATLFAEPLVEGPKLQGRAADLVHRLAYLAPRYEDLSRILTPEGPETVSGRERAFLAAIARGQTPAENRPLPDLPHAAAVAAAFSGARIPSTLRDQLRQGRLGETMLRAIALCASGAQGNAIDLTEGLATLRALGLEDTARRTALQLMLLDAERARR